MSNLGETLAGQRDVGNWGNNATGRRDWANGFTTGSNTGGYTLRSVTVKFGNANGSPDALTVAIYDDSSGAPVSSVATLSGDSAPTTADDYIYTGSTDCDLGAGEAYHVALSVNFAQSAYYAWSRTASNDETNTPGNAGWSIADNGHRKVGGWTTYGASSLSED